MNKKNINKTVTITLVFALLLSVAFVVGIPIIILGATGGKYVLMAVGIVFVVMGFYGTPLIWVKFSLLKSKRNVFYAITDGMYSINDLSINFNQKTTQMISTVSWLISKRYLVGYSINPARTAIIPLNNSKQCAQTDEPERHSAKCDACNAVFEYTNKAKSCPYCGSPIK